MKKVMIILGLILFVIKGFAQDVTPYQITEVVKVDSVSKDELYERALDWFVNAYRDADKVTQLKDKENGQISGKALIPYEPTKVMDGKITVGYLRYTINIFVKDGRYKYEIINFRHEAGALAAGGAPRSFGLLTSEEKYPGEISGFMLNRNWHQRQWDDMKLKAKIGTSDLILSLKKSMNKKLDTKKNSW